MANPRSRYSAEFKAEAIILVLEQNQPQSAVSRNLKISNQTLSNWITKSRHGELSNGSSDSASTDVLEAENKRLRKALAVAEMERDILKKATAFFAKDTMRGTHS
jgi:transposase